MSSLSSDLVIFGATPGGIAAALSAARAGLEVLLVNHTAHVGGFLSSGCGGWEAPYDGPRSAIFSEMLDAISAFYAGKYGEDSPQYRASRPSPVDRTRLGRPKVEPHVAEHVFERLLAAERSIKLVKGYHPWKAEVRNGLVSQVSFVSGTDEEPFTATAAVFADGSYEGDLAAVCGAEYRVGREGREEFNEPHAGRIFTRNLPHEEGWPRDAYEGRLNIRYFGHSSGEALDHPESGQPDACVMAYNFRAILTDDPGNRVYPDKPRSYDQFDPAAPVLLSLVKNLPNRKLAWNGGRLIGPQHAYPEASWKERRAIEARYREFMLCQLWHLQNEAELPEEQKRFWQSHGLARDEFADNGHFPHEIYVREARRIRGLKIFTEHDGMPAPGLGRTPIHPDSIAITDWPLDSVAVHAERFQGSNADGVFFLAEQSRPAQVPYGCLVSRNVGNLLVPVCLSASHVGWGSIRLEPVWVQCGEAAGLAAAEAIRRNAPCASVEPGHLQQKLLATGSMLAFLNDVEHLSADEHAAIQHAALQGFFPTYDARPDDLLSLDEAKIWGMKADPAERARCLWNVQGSGTPVTPSQFGEIFGISFSGEGAPSRKQACQILFGPACHQPVTL